MNSDENKSAEKSTSYYYFCRACGEDFSSNSPQHVCAECLSSKIEGGEVKTN